MSASAASWFVRIPGLRGLLFLLPIASPRLRFFQEDRGGGSRRTMDVIDRFLFRRILRARRNRILLFSAAFMTSNP